MTKTLIAIACLAFVTSACARIGAVRLEHPITGEVQQCGPYAGLTNITYLGAVELQRGCIEDFRAQGYERVSEP